MITHTALQYQALLKATSGYAVDTIGVRFHRVIELANKTAPLNTNEVAILEHFVHSNADVLKNTVYYGDEIIHPVTRDKRNYYRQTNTGLMVERKPGSGQHLTAKRLARLASEPPRVSKPRGRPRKTPKTV